MGASRAEGRQGHSASIRPVRLGLALFQSLGLLTAGGSGFSGHCTRLLEVLAGHANERALRGTHQPQVLSRSWVMSRGDRQKLPTRPIFRKPASPTGAALWECRSCLYLKRLFPVDLVKPPGFWDSPLYSLPGCLQSYGNPCFCSSPKETWAVLNFWVILSIFISPWIFPGWTLAKHWMSQ